MAFRIRERFWEEVSIKTDFENFSVENSGEGSPGWRNTMKPSMLGGCCAEEQRLQRAMFVEGGSPVVEEGAGTRSLWRSEENVLYWWERGNRLCFPFEKDGRRGAPGD